MSKLPHVEGVSHRQVAARGIEFHLAEAGSGEDVVICLHGWPQHWYMWRRLMPMLADRHRVLALDLRGFGWSDAPPGGYEKENMASDVSAVLDALGIGRVKVVGHDWGGWIAFLLALREESRIERLLALGIVPPWPRFRTSLPHSWRFAYQLPIVAPGIGYMLHRRGALVPRVLVRGSTNRNAWEEQTLRVFADTYAEPDRARAAVRLYRTFVLKEVPALLRGRYEGLRLTVPTRLINGADDFALAPDLLSGYEHHVEEMEVEIVEHCGHFIVDELPDLVGERARSFLG